MTKVRPQLQTAVKTALSELAETGASNLADSAVCCQRVVAWVWPGMGSIDGCI